MKIKRIIPISVIGLFIVLLNPTLGKAQSKDTLEESTYKLGELDPPNMANTIVGIVVGRMEHLKNPEVSKKERKKGEVTAQVTISKEGKLLNPVIVQSLGKAYDEEAMRVIKVLQDKKWEPGLKEGVPVNVTFLLPFEFPVKQYN